MLAAIAIYTLARIPAVEAKATSSSSASSRTSSTGSTSIPGAVSLDELTIPVDRTVRLELTTWDVNHSWWVPPLTGKKDAIAGQVNVLRFKPEETGTWEGQCAELCGIQHAVMYTRVHVVEQAGLRRLAGRPGGHLRRGSRPPGVGGGLRQVPRDGGGGGVGPPVSGNGTLRNRQALIRLLSTGQNTPQLPSYMPPVGLGWNGKQYDALVAYVKATPASRGHRKERRVAVRSETLAPTWKEGRVMRLADDGRPAGSASSTSSRPSSSSLRPG